MSQQQGDDELVQIILQLNSAPTGRLKALLRRAGNRREVIELSTVFAITTTSFKPDLVALENKLTAAESRTDS